MRQMNWKLLTAFEAVARHRNFSRAATELNVQQPAISRRVAALEAELGVSLLRRTRPTATLTREGEVLFLALTGGIAEVRSALDQVRQTPDRDLVTVNTTIGFANCYLMKRLPTFRAANPDVTIELISRDLNDSYADGRADIVIVFDRPDRLPGTRQARIFPEVLVPVARPALAAAVADEPAALVRQPLLHLTMGLHGEDWRTYFEGTGAMPAPPSSDRRFTSFVVYLQAALNGDGIMLGWETLLRDQIELGQLAPASSRRVRTSRGYFACLTPRATASAAAVRLWDWLAALEQFPD